jgi:hypothetical protein
LVITVGSANLSEFFSAPYRTVPQQTVYRSKKLLKINEKCLFISKRLAFLTFGLAILCFSLKNQRLKR